MPVTMWEEQEEWIMTESLEYTVYAQSAVATRLSRCQAKLRAYGLWFDFPLAAAAVAAFIADSFAAGAIGGLVGLMAAALLDSWLTVRIHQEILIAAHAGEGAQENLLSSPCR